MATSGTLNLHGADVRAGYKYTVKELTGGDSFDVISYAYDGVAWRVSRLDGKLPSAGDKFLVKEVTDPYRRAIVRWSSEEGKEGTGVKSRIKHYGIGADPVGKVYFVEAPYGSDKVYITRDLKNPGCYLGYVENPGLEMGGSFKVDAVVGDSWDISPISGASTTGAKMTGNVYSAVMVRSKTVAAGEGVTTGVVQSEVVYTKENFVALSDDTARAIALAEAITKVAGLDVTDPTKPIEVKLAKYGA